MCSHSYDEWSQLLLDYCGHYYGVCNPKKSGFNGHFHVHNWYNLDVIDISCDLEKITRSKHDVLRDDNEYIFLLKQISGQTITSHNDKCCTLNPGDFLLLDSTLSADLIFQSKPSKFLSVHMPRSEFIYWCQTDILIGEACKANDLKSRALNVAFPADNDGCDISKMGTDFIFDLARLAFVREKKNPSIMRCSNRQNRYFATLQILNKNLSNSNLTIEWLAKATNMSTRQLQRDFQAQGTSFSSILTERRLDSFIEKILQCLQHSSTIPNIASTAFSCGFGDISNFNRAFKKRYGCSPTEYLSMISS